MENFFYEDELKQKIKTSLLEKQALEWAKHFIDRERKTRDKPLSSSQLRKFHFEVKTIEERLNNKIKQSEIPEKTDDEFSKMKPFIKLLKSKVAYACRTPGKERKVPETFKKYIDDMIDKIHDYKDFKAFSLCFDAVVGYFYGEGGSR